jgi:hypothetical protein
VLELWRKVGARGLLNRRGSIQEGQVVVLRSGSSGLVAVLAYGQTWFGLGVSARDIIRATVTEMHQQQR